MTRPRRALLLLLPLVLGLPSLVGPGRAQTTSARFAFADTTLLRDTLSLHFSRLFPLSDSLGMVPDTLRALSIRYRLPLERLVRIADSLSIPVDSVGVVLERERYNPLAAGGRNATTFHYGTTYNIAQTSSTWNNGSDYNLTRGSLFVHNVTSINMDRLKNGGITSLRQTRSSTTEGGVRFSPDLSLGGRVNLERFNSHDPGSTQNENETKNELQVSMRSRQRPAPGLSSEVNFFTGLLDLSNLREIKRGLNGDLNGGMRYARGNWLSHDFNGQVTGNFARTRTPTAIASLNTQDFSENIRGTLAVFPNAPVGLNLLYNLRDVRVQTALDSGRIQQVQSHNDGADLTARLRRDSDRYLNLLGRFSNARQLITGGPTGQRNSKRDRSAGTDGRYALLGFTLDGRFSLGRTESEFPNGGYGESLYVRTIESTLSRRLGARVVGKASGGVSLSSYRYYRLGTATGQLPVKRDEYRQNYRLEGLYTASAKLNSAVALEVTRSMLVNLPSASASANNEDRVYRAEWRWSYRLLPGLTATQRNQINAHYVFYTSRSQINTLSLDYGTLTTLNAIITPRLTVDLTHNSSVQPSGNFVVQQDGASAFSRASESQNYTLSARMAYTPSPHLSLSMEPSYLANNRDGTLDGESVPQRRSRSLNFSGGASLNFPIGQRGRLTGDIRRSYQASRSTEFAAGLPRPSTRGRPLDYWNGSLQLTWDL